MSKNKFLKRLLALGIATVSAASVFGLAACNPDAGNEGGDDEGNNGGGGSTPTQLAAPTLALDATNKKITWNAVDHADGYTVYEKLTTATTDPTSHAVTACEYAITQTVAGTYEYYVVATSTSEDYTTSSASNKVEYEVTASTTTPDAENITVHFVTGKDGVTVPDQTIPNNSKATRPTDPVCEGFVFVDWYTSDAHKTVVDFDKNIVVRGGDDEISYYAKWRVATPYDTLSKSSSKIIAEDFSTTTSLNSIAGWNNAGTPGVYTRSDKTPDNVIIDNGVVKFGAATTETRLLADFGYVKDTVHGYLEVKMKKVGGSWAFFRLIGTDNVKTKDEVISLRSASGNKLAYRLDGAGSDVATDVTLVAGTTYAIEYTVSLSTQKVTLKVNDTVVANEVTVPGLGSIFGFELSSDSSNDKSFDSIDYIAVAAEQATLEEYAAAKVSAITTKYNATTLNDTDLGSLGNGILTDETGLIAVHTGYINAATSFADVDSAYVAAVKAIEAQILVNAKENACSKIENYMPAGKTYTGEQLTALNNAKATVKGEINAESVDSVAKVKAALTAGYATLDAVDDDTAAQKATITVTIKGKKSDGGEQAIGTFTVKSGETVTLAEIEAKITVPFGYFYEGLYKDGELGEKITDTFAGKAAESDTTDEVYAKLTKTTLYDMADIASAHPDLVDGSNWNFNNNKDIFAPEVGPFTLGSSKTGFLHAYNGTVAGTDKTFTHIFRPSGGQKVDGSDGYILTAKQNLTLVIYWTSVDGSDKMKELDVSYKIDGQVAHEGTTGFTPTANVAYKTDKITLTAEQVLTIYPSVANRLCIFAIEYVVNA